MNTNYFILLLLLFAAVDHPVKALPEEHILVRFTTDTEGLPDKHKQVGPLWTTAGRIMDNLYKYKAMDTIKIESSLSKIVASFKKKSFEDFKKLIFQSEDYIALIKQMGNQDTTDDPALKEVLQILEQQIEANFQRIIKKGEDKGLIWEQITFEGYVFNSEEMSIGTEIKEKGFLVDSHIRLTCKDENYTLIGIQLWLFNDVYKVKADEMRGIFKIDLDIFVPAEKMYLEEMEENGY
ncbi:MAG: hypothetical protein AAF990_07875 [Bacteroidota bacterium]